MHDAQDDGRDDGDDERYGEIIDDDLDLTIAVVVAHDDGPILPRIVAGELGPDVAVVLGEVRAQNVRRISAAFNVDEEDGLRAIAVVYGRVVAVRRVIDVNVRTVEHVRRATFAARTPRTVKYTRMVFAPRRRASDRLRRKVGHQRRYGRIDVERDEEEQRRAGRYGRHREEGRRVEPDFLAERPLRRFGLLGRLRRQVEQLLFAELCFRVE